MRTRVNLRKGVAITRALSAPVGFAVGDAVRAVGASVGAPVQSVGAIASPVVRLVS